MKSITLILKSGNNATFFFDGNLVVTSDDAGKNVKIHDATHNNGGWQLLPDYTHADIVRLIENKS
jgi:hypothetical protein